MSDTEPAPAHSTPLTPVDDRLWRSHIRTRVLRRLFIAWLLLSPLFGGLALVIELHRQERLVLHLALTEAASFSSESTRSLEHLDDAARADLSRAAVRLVNQHFAVVELYDHDQRLVVIGVGRGQAAAEAVLNRKAHPFPAQGSV